MTAEITMTCLYAAVTRVDDMLLLLKVFHDLGDERIVTQDSVVRGRFLGKGAFGAVYAGTMVDKVCLLTL